jgi:hypothetical protein
MTSMMTAADDNDGVEMNSVVYRGRIRGKRPRMRYCKGVYNCSKCLVITLEEERNGSGYAAIIGRTIHFARFVIEGWVVY